MLYFLFFFQQLVASSTHLFAKHITETLHPAVVVLYRGAFSIIVYALWMLIRHNTIRRIERSDWPLLLFLGLINIPVNQLMFVWGLKYTTAPDASLAYALSPAFVLVISRLLHGEELTRTKIIGIAVAILGTLVILLEKGLSFSSDHLLGNCIELGASTAWAFYTVFGRRMAMKYGAVYSTALSMLIGFIIYVPMYSMLPVQHVPLSSLNSDQLFAVVYLGVITSGLGFALWYYLLTKMVASKVAVFNNLQPVLTTALAFIVSGQIPSPVFVLGGVIVLTGVVVTQRG